jgi:WD40 repeat protein
MVSASKAAAMKSILTPSMTLNGHGEWIESISYLPDGQRMISESHDKTARQWDLKVGKEIEEARDVCEEEVSATAVLGNGRWVITGGGNLRSAELKACEVETGIVKKFQGHSLRISCIDISVDNTLLASGSFDWTARVWNLETGKLVTGPFNSIHFVSAVRFTTDSKKLAVKSISGNCLEVWDVQSQKLDMRIGRIGAGFTLAPIFWTKNNKHILTAFNFTEDDDANTIYEFDASTLKIVGTPFEGHTEHISGLALSFDGTLLATASHDDTIKLWAFESRQLLASFDVQNPFKLILSPDSHKLAYTTYTTVFSPDLPRSDHATTSKEHRICICDTPSDVLAQARVRNPHKTSTFFCANNPLAEHCTQKASLQ